MGRLSILLTGSLLTVSACSSMLQTMTRSEAIAMCQEKASAATAPTYGVTAGVNSNTGLFGGLQINLSDAYIRGLDPAVVYESCMNDLAANGQITEGN